MRNKILVFVVLITFIGLCAWSPWLSQNIAFKFAETQFNLAWEGVIDGCGTFGDDLGAKEYRKVPFGAVVTLDYQCGLVAPDETPLHTKVYISFFGIAFGYPKP